MEEPRGKKMVAKTRKVNVGRERRKRNLSNFLIDWVKEIAGTQNVL